MKTIVLLRHADVDPPIGPAPDDLPLNAAGRERAETLAQVLGDTGVTRIFVSAALRTQQTVAPLAARLALQPEQTPFPVSSQFVQQVLSGPDGDVVLFAGHSNTVPQMITALGASFPGPPIHGHDDLFIVTIADSGEAHAVRLKYGAPSL